MGAEHCHQEPSIEAAQLHDLIVEGNRLGFLTREQVMQLMEATDLEAEWFGEVTTLLEEQGIEVVEGDFPSNGNTPSGSDPQSGGEV
jgi:hypothetical protein